MKTIGLIGGMSWESSLEYYRIINETAKLELGGLHSAKCIMYSVDFSGIESLLRKGKWKDLTSIMVDIATKLKNSGADFIVICTNTMHKMAGDIEKKAGIKVLHIAEAAGKKIAEKGMRKVALLGTKFTMEEDFYKKVLKDKYNISVVIPEKDDRGLINDVIFNELCKGILNDDSKNQFLRIIEKLAAKGAEGVILGCTEIPLLIKQEDVKIPVFDTTAIHAVSAFEFAIKESI